MVELLPIVAIAAIFWLLIIRPASRQRKQTAALQAGLSVGDDIMLTSGIFGTIVSSDDAELEVQVAEGVVIRVVRGAVASVRRDDPITDPAADEPAAPSNDHDEER